MEQIQFPECLKCSAGILIPLQIMEGKEHQFYTKLGFVQIRNVDLIFELIMEK